MSWDFILSNIKNKISLDNLTNYYPRKEDVLKAFELTPFDHIKIVILGQDCYYSCCPKTKQPYANGLAFSVPNECTIPKSLKNIFKKLEEETGIKNVHGDLTKWAEQGVLLMNTQLTVEQGKPNTHKFWSPFTDDIIRQISDNLNGVVFVLWGSNALKKRNLIDETKHKIIITSHPSPLSCYRSLKNYPSFNEYNLFTEINRYYRIDWQL